MYFPFLHGGVYGAKWKEHFVRQCTHVVSLTEYILYIFKDKFIWKPMCGSLIVLETCVSHMFIL
jgi:hypothetical protein